MNNQENNTKTSNNLKEKNLAYGGQALIEGVLMRGQSGYAFTVKKPDDKFYKEKKDYTPIGKKIKFLGFPFIRGVVGLFENLILGVKILNKSAEIAFPEEETEKTSTFGMVLVFVIALVFALFVFNGIPLILASIFKVDINNNPILFNVVSGIIRLLLFFIYIVSISFLNDTKRLFGYHGAEHKVIHAYEAKKELTIENVKKSPRLHPRCGTSFVFIVFLITLVVFPFFNFFFNSQSWYNSLYEIPDNISAQDLDTLILKKLKDNNEKREFLLSLYTNENGKMLLKDNFTKKEKIRATNILKSVRYNWLGRILQKLIHLVAHVFIGMPIVASISYEILKLSGRFSKNPIIKIFIAPGLFFQLFTTREPDESMMKSSILSLRMLLGEEDVDVVRSVDDSYGKTSLKLSTLCLIFPILLF